MGRLPKIILMIAAMTAIFLWMSTAFNACGNNADGLLDDTSGVMEEIVDDTDEFVNDLGDDLFEDDDLFANTEDTDDSDFVTADEAVDMDFTDATSYEDTDYTSTDNTSYSSTSYSSGNSTGDYMVIAGNYLVQSNARSMTKKLANLGYPNAEIGVFDMSQYHTVIAYRDDSYGSALEIANAIKRQGIDCYVKKRQF